MAQLNSPYMRKFKFTIAYNHIICSCHNYQPVRWENGSLFPHHDIPITYFAYYMTIDRVIRWRSDVYSFSMNWCLWPWMIQPKKAWIENYQATSEWHEGEWNLIWSDVLVLCLLLHIWFMSLDMNVSTGLGAWGLRLEHSSYYEWSKDAQSNVIREAITSYFVSIVFRG